MSDFPTVGLAVDLSQIDTGTRAYTDLEKKINDVGAAADKTAAKVAAATQSTTAVATKGAAARGQAEGDLTYKIDAETQRQLGVWNKLNQQRATGATATQAQINKIVSDAAAFEQNTAAVRAANQQRWNADRAAASAAVAQMIQRQEEVAAEATAARLNALAKEVTDFALGQYARRAIAVQENLAAEVAAMREAEAAFATSRAAMRVNAADAATTAIATGGAGFAVSGDAQAMAASIAATTAALNEQAGAYARVTEETVVYTAAQTAAVDVQARDAAVKQAVQAQNAAMIAKAYGLSAASEAVALAALKEGKNFLQAAEAASQHAAALAEAQARGAALMASLDPRIAAQQKFNAIQKEANELQKLGGLTDLEHAAAMRLAKRDLDAAASATGNLGGIVREVAVIIREFFRGDWSRMAGSASILSQRMGLLSDTLIASAMPWAAMAAVMAIVIAATVSYEGELQKVTDLAAGAGAAIGLQAGAIEDAAKRGADASNQSIGAARNQADAYAATGAIGTDVSERLISLTTRYANATNQSAKQASADLSKMFSDPGKGVDELDKKLHGFVSESQREYIESLAKAGDAAGAQRAMLEALVPAIDNVSNHVQGLAGVFNDLGRIGSAAWDKIGQFFSQGNANGFANYAGAAGYQFQQDYNAKKQVDYWSGLSQSAVQFRNDQQTTGFDAAKAVTYGGSVPFAGTLSATKRGLQAQVDNLTTAQGFGGSADLIKAEADAIDRLRGALDSVRDPAQHDVDIDKANIQVKGAITPLQKAAAAAAKQRADDEGKLYTAVEENRRVQAAYDAALAQADKTHARHGQTIENGIAALVADAAAALSAADAYDQNTAAGNRAEAARKAAEKAAKERMSTEQASRELIAQETDAVAKQIEGWAKATTTLQEQASARSHYNDLIAAGSISIQGAADALQVENAAREKNDTLGQIDNNIRQTEALITTASGAAKQQLIALLKTERDARAQTTKEIERQNKADEDAIYNAQRLALLTQARNSADQAAIAAAHAAAVGTGPYTQAVVGAQAPLLQSFQQNDEFFGRLGPSRDQQAALDALKKEALAQQEVADAQDSYNKSLTYTVTLLERMAATGAQTASGLAAAFGSLGQGVGDMLNAILTYRVEQQRTADDVVLAQNKVDDAYAQGAEGTLAWMKASSDLADTQQKADHDATLSKQKLTDTTLEGFRSMFAQGSVAYKALTGLDMAYRATQIAGSIGAIVQNAAETASVIASSISQAASLAAVGAAKMFAMLGPFGFAAVAAMAAVLAGFGIRALGGGGGGAAQPTAADLQKVAGTGSMLGDPSTQSDSLSKSLANAQKYQDKQLGYSSVMTHSLQSIDSNISGLTNLIARQLGVSGAFGTGGLGLGTTSSHGDLKGGAVAGGLAFAGLAGGSAALMAGFGGSLVLGPIGLIAGAIGLLIASMIKTTVTTALTDQGLNFPAQTVGSIASSGFAGSTYQDVAVSSHKSLLGIGLGTSTQNVEVNGALPGDFQKQATLIIQSLRSGVLTAATTLGVDGAQAAVDAFTVDLGKISIKDLKTADIQAELEAVFSKAGDDMAAAAAPFLANFQKAGEGLFQTLSRVATDYATIDTTLASIGKSFGATGLQSIGARENLLGADLFGSLDTFTSQVGAYADAFLTDAEKIAPVQKAVSQAMADMGYASITTKDQFKALVNSLDLTTTDGQKAFASLLAIAPAFGQVADAAATAATTASDAAAAAAKANADAAAAVLQAQEAQAATNNNLLVSLFQAQGMNAEATALQRRLTLAGITDPTQSKLQQDVFDAQDRQAAATTAATTAQNTLTASMQRAQSLYQAQAQTLQSTIDQFKGLSTTLRDARAQLDVSNDNLSPLSALANAQDQFSATLAKAQGGDATAMGALPGAGQTLLQLAQQYAPSAQVYNTILAQVKKGYETTADIADHQVDVAQQQLNTLNDMAKSLGLVDTGVTDLNTAFGVLAQALAAAANLNVKDPQWGAVQNMAANKALAAATGYAGAFGGGGFDQFIQGASLATRSQARDILGQYGQSSRVTFSTSDPQWGDYRNIAANHALAAATGYAGSFGGGGFQAWIVQQAEQVKIAARQVLTQFNQADRIKFANGAAFTGSIVSRPTDFALGQMGEAGPEGVLPLANVGGRLGVRATNDNGALVAEVRALRDEVAQFRLEQEELGLQAAAVRGKSLMITKSWDGNGMPAVRS